MNNPAPPSIAPNFPPDKHVTRDLGPIVERRDGQSFITLPIVPEVLDNTGRPRVGALAMVVDIIAGEGAIRAVLPGWVATSNLSIQVSDLPSTGSIRACPRVVRQGRTTLVMEVLLEVPETATQVGLSTLSFAILPRRSEMQARVDWAEQPEARTDFGGPGAGFEKPLLDAIGLHFDPVDPATSRIEVQPYLLNTLGALQGGAVAIVIDAAAEHFAAARLAGPVRVRSLEVHYLKLCRVGPIRVTVSDIARTASGLIARVELHDEGQEGVLTTVGTVLVDAAN